MHEYATSMMVDELLKQKEANDAIVSVLRRRIDDLETEKERQNCSLFLLHLFFLKHKDLITEFVELAYKDSPECARRTVAALHDEAADLSKIDCTGDDFKPW